MLKLLVPKEMQLKTTMKIPLFNSLAKVKNVTSVNEDIEKMEPPYSAGGSVK